MKKTTKARLRQIIYTVAGILCVGVILCTAFVFPKYYCLFNDKKTLNKLNYMDISVNTYETAYSSFAEKIHALARVTTAGNSLQAIQVNEPEMETSKKELTDIVNEEITELYKNDVIPQKINLTEKKNSLSQRYTIYETNKQNSFKGISCWKLVYSGPKRTVTIYLDEEYHKIYYLKIQHKNTNINNPFIGFGEMDYSKISGDFSTGYQRNSYNWWDGLLQYYDIPSYKDTEAQELNEFDLVGHIYFKDNCMITIKENYYDDRKKQIDYQNNNKYSFFWDAGILIEKMIQF